MDDSPRRTPSNSEAESSSGERYSDDRAAAALRRAAELQVEAAERAGHALARLGPTVDHDGFERGELVVAAREAGIDEQFVQVALAELDSENRALAEVDASKDRAITRWLGTRRRSVSVSRLIDAPADRTWQALVEVAENDDWRLRLGGSSGGHPTDGGVATFTMMRLGEMMSRRRSHNQLCMRMEQLEAWAVQATLRRHAARTEVALYMDLRPGALTNLKWAKISTWVGALGGGGGGVALGVGAGALAIGGGALLGAAGVAALSIGVWRVAYRSAAQRLVALLDDLLADVQSRTERQALLGSGESSDPA